MGEKEKKRVKSGHYVSYLIITLLHRSIVSMSWDAARRLARSAADIGRALDRKQRKGRMYRQIREIFPELDSCETRKLIREVYRWLFESVVDTLHFHNNLSSANIGNYVEFHNESGRPWPDKSSPMIFVTGHFGWWEIGLMTMANIGYPSVVIVRPMDNPLLERFIADLRETFGNVQIPKRGGLRTALKTLKKGERLSLMIDQDSRKYGIFVDFLGKPAATHDSPAKLALTAEVPVAFLYCLRIGDTKRFKLVLKDVVKPNLEADRELEAIRITQRLSDNLSELVRENLPYWLWLHRRWKTYPGKYDERK